MEPSEKAYAVADEVVLGALGVGNAAQVIQRALDEAAAAERAKVVAWLREQSVKGFIKSGHADTENSKRIFFSGAYAVQSAAELIEQGAHHDPA